jgi:membrane-bound inhibitor of C-type lysozyme
LKRLMHAPLLAITFLSPASASPPTAIRYTCDDGRVVTATYPSQTTALLTFAGETLTLTLAPSADGARYISPAWQWWAKGLHDASLAPLAPGETLAVAPGIHCHAPP